jgi:HlyD family secretion protein
MNEYAQKTKKHARLIFLLLALLVLSAIWIRNEKPAPKNIIKVSGNIEITDIEVSFKIAGRVDKRLVDEGITVQAGQLIAVLDTAELIHEVELKQADAAAAEANLLEQVNGYLPEEIAQAKAKLQKAEADHVLQNADYSRQKRLFEQQVISQREFETSKAQYEKARAQYRESAEYFTLLQKGTRVEKIKQSEANLQQAKQSLVLAEIRLGYAHLYSPINGYVLTKNVEDGEYVSPGTPIVTIGNLDTVWIRAYINETELGLIKLGQKVNVTTDTYPEKIYQGRIAFISPQAEFTPKNVQTQKERVKLVYRVKIDLPNPNQELKPGMPADGYIMLD